MHKITTRYRIYAETVVSLIVVITAIKLTRIIPQLKDSWYLTPAILFTAALIPTLIKKQNLTKTILPLGQIKISLKLLAKTSIIIFPLLFIALWLLTRFDLNLPMAPVPPEKNQIAAWIIFQLLYIATFEEIFFRAYLQSNILNALNQSNPTTPKTAKKLYRHQWTAITISSAAFTLAHIIINESPAQILVFLPAMILGYLFTQTKSLIAPILFHGISNTVYCLIAQLLTN